MGQCCPGLIECSPGVCVADASECETEVYCCCGCNDAGKCNEIRDAAAMDSSCWNNDQVSMFDVCARA